MTKFTFTAVDARGRTVTNILPVAILRMYYRMSFIDCSLDHMMYDVIIASPVLPTPPIQVLSIVGKNGTLSLTDLQSLAGTTLTATSTGDLQLWTDATGVHW